jgi:CubicO group peptidase (beta-lactamase class C family)
LPLDEYLASAIFGPLGMIDSGFYVPPDKVGRLAAVYDAPDGVLHKIDDAETREITEHIPLLSGGGGCASTVLDYLRFTRMLSRRGELDGVRLLKPETVAQMTSNQLAPPLWPLEIGGDVSQGEGYGLGVGVIVEASPESLAGSVGTYDWGGSWNTDFWVDPVRDLSAIYMVQLQPRPSLTSPGREYWSLISQAVID